MVSDKNHFETFDTRAGDIESYSERLEMHLLANAMKRKAILLSSLGGDAYHILKDITDRNPMFGWTGYQDL